MIFQCRMKCLMEKFALDEAKIKAGANRSNISSDMTWKKIKIQKIKKKSTTKPIQQHFIQHQKKGMLDEMLDRFASILQYKCSKKLAICTFETFLLKGKRYDSKKNLALIFKWIILTILKMKIFFNLKTETSHNHIFRFFYLS
uniref:Uncharacterized protein n=1 Tax=Clytia hemisphaerica TaxID=252671 RepID=A0A7M5X1L2_9CNID